MDLSTSKNHSQNEDFLDDEHLLVEEEVPDHFFRTEIPNIVDDMGLDPIQFRVYCKLKRIAGDAGKCWKCLKKLAAECAISERKLRDVLKHLSCPFSILGQLPLIKIMARKKQDGSRDSSVISMVNIWKVNGEYFRNIKINSSAAPRAGGVRHHVPGGAAPRADKEDLCISLLDKDSDTVIENKDLSKVVEKVTESLPFPEKEVKKKEPKPKTQEEWVARLSVPERQFHDIVTSWDPPNGPKVESHFITNELRNYGLLKMEQAWQFSLQYVAKHGISKAFGAIMRKALQNNCKPVDVEYEEKRSYAESLKIQCSEINITEKYVSIPSISWDLYFHEPIDRFKRLLYQKFDYIRGQRCPC